MFTGWLSLQLGVIIILVSLTHLDYHISFSFVRDSVKLFKAIRQR